MGPGTEKRLVLEQGGRGGGGVVELHIIGDEGILIDAQGSHQNNFTSYKMAASNKMSYFTQGPSTCSKLDANMYVKYCYF